jgi:cytochrome c-type biogenesis protein
MAIDVTLGGAAVAGLLSFVSPCVLPLVPPYLCFLAGVTLDELTGTEKIESPRLRVVGTAIAFVAGFSLVFVSLGASASIFGRFLTELLSYRVDILGFDVNLLPLLTGLVIVGIGLHFLGVYQLAFLNREARLHVKRHPAGPLGAFFVGIAFAFGWTPCIGPVLGAILLVAGTENTAAQGATLLGAYSIGMGLPFIAAALFAGPFMNLMKHFRRYMLTVERAMGALLVLTGVLFISGQMTALSFWLLETFPALGQLG